LLNPPLPNLFDCFVPPRSTKWPWREASGMKIAGSARYLLFCLLLDQIGSQIMVTFAGRREAPQKEY